MPIHRPRPRMTAVRHRLLLPILCICHLRLRQPHMSIRAWLANRSGSNQSWPPTRRAALLVQTTQLYSCDVELQYYFAQYGNALELQCIAVSQRSSGASRGIEYGPGVYNQVACQRSLRFDVLLNAVTYSGTGRLPIRIILLAGTIHRT